VRTAAVLSGLGIAGRVAAGNAEVPAVPVGRLPACSS
jgi:hypothetical protein